MIVGRVSFAGNAQAAGTISINNVLTGLEAARGYELAGSTWLGLRGTFAWSGQAAVLARINLVVTHSNTSFVPVTGLYIGTDRNVSDVLWWEELREPVVAGVPDRDNWANGLYFRNIVQKSRRALRGSDQTINFIMDNPGASTIDWWAQFKFAVRLP